MPDDLFSAIFDGFFASTSPEHLRQMIRTNQNVADVFRLGQYRWLVRLSGDNLDGLTTESVMGGARERYPKHYRAVMAESNGRVWVAGQVENIKKVLLG